MNNMKYICLALTLFLLVFLISGCKETDTTQPVATTQAEPTGVTEVDDINTDISDVDTLDEDLSLNGLGDIDSELDSISW